MSRLTATSFRGLLLHFSMSTALLLLAACTGRTGPSNVFSSTPPVESTIAPAGPNSPPTPPSGPSSAPASARFVWAIPFTVSGLATGTSLSVVLNGIYARTILSDSPVGGADFFVPEIPVGYSGLPTGSTYYITVGSQPAGETCTVSNGVGTLLSFPGPSAAVIACVPTSPPAAPPPLFAATAAAVVRPAVPGHPPTAREGAIAFTDSSGNFWLFGGSERSAAGGISLFSDLWKFSPDVGDWSRVLGSELLHTPGHYGIKGESSPTNAPGARASAMAWTDASGDLWMFGGEGRDVSGTAGALGDLWRFSIATRQWTWVSGAQIVNSPGLYGVQNAPSIANHPGARSHGATWMDSAGTLWLFGGYGRDSSGANGSLDDLWQFVPATRTWTWVSGSNAAYLRGTR
jgi:hypothetical protein